jgi:hypothetical protein
MPFFYEVDPETVQSSKLWALLRLGYDDQSHDRGDFSSSSMVSDGLIAQTPRGSTIQRIEDGKFVVCDENVCFCARSLYLAEEQLEEMELGYRFPYSTSFRKVQA